MVHDPYNVFHCKILMKFLNSCIVRLYLNYLVVLFLPGLKAISVKTYN
jgi:hypothetical protein